MKRRHHEEHINHERWAIPYGDLITLLLALFVVMYAVSAVNETKFRVMAQSINEAFNGTGKVIEPIREATPAAQVPLPNQSRAPAAAPIAKIDVPIPPRNLPLPGHEGAAPDRQEAASVNTATAANTAIGKTEAASLSQIADEVQRAMKPLIDKNMVSVRKTPDWLEIEVRTDILFPVGVAKLQAPAEDVLRKLAGILSPFPNAMRVEGYTDNTPIATATFPPTGSCRPPARPPWRACSPRPASTRIGSASSVGANFVPRPTTPRTKGAIGIAAYSSWS